MADDIAALIDYLGVDRPDLVGYSLGGDRVCDLHALATLERDRGWFQEHGRLSSTRSKAIIQGVNRLCADLRAEAAMLVDGFGIPDAVLAAPIAIDPGPVPVGSSDPAPRAGPS